MADSLLTAMKGGERSQSGGERFWAYQPPALERASAAVGRAFAHWSARCAVGALVPSRPRSLSEARVRETRGG